MRVVIFREKEEKIYISSGRNRSIPRVSALFRARRAGAKKGHAERAGGGRERIRQNRGTFLSLLMAAAYPGEEERHSGISKHQGHVGLKIVRNALKIVR